MKKAVFFDIDGTLWDDDLNIPVSTVESIRKLREQGDYAFICSGRSRANICNEKLLAIGFDGIVASCGAHIDFQGEKIFEKLLSEEEVGRILDALSGRHVLTVLEGPRYTYVNEDEFRDNPYVNYLKQEQGERVKNIAGSVEFEINKLSVDAREEGLGGITEILKDEFDIIPHNEWLAEIVPKGYSKATGIQKVCELLQIAHEDTYAFGDSANDLEMLRYAAHGIAMGNGTEAAKEAADYVTTNLSDDGIKNGLLHYGLIV